MNRNQYGLSGSGGGLRMALALQRITSSPGGCIRLLLVWCFGIALGAMLAGCKTAPEGNLGDTLTFVGVEAASCAAAQSKPAAVPYLKTAGAVFVAFAIKVPPTPSELEAALGNLPGNGLSQAEQRLVWLGATTAYRLVWSDKLTEAQATRLRAVLGGIGSALTSGAGCAPQTTSRAVRAKTEGLKAGDLKSVGEAVGVAVKAGKSGE
jgi:hypothetical protein